MKKQPIAATNEWEAFIAADNETVELIRGSKTLLLPIEDVPEFWQLLDQVNRRLSATSGPQAETSSTGQVDNQDEFPSLLLKSTRFSFVTEFRLLPWGVIERRTVKPQGGKIPDNLGEWEPMEPSGVEMSRKYIPEFDNWLREINWRPPAQP